MIYWFTGQPGSGKTTLALALKAALQKAGCTVVHLDGEFLREITANGDFTKAGRTRNIKAGQLLAAKLHAEGVNVVASFVSPYRDIREAFKTKEEVLEIYVHTAETRGKESHFAADFQPPQERFLDIDTTGISVDDCVERILRATLLPKRAGDAHG
jgi:adenylylsulfate kinase-like enzyme